MKAETRNKIAIGSFILAILTECIAALVFLLPIAGFMFYPFVSGVAAILSVICCIFAGEKPALRIISVIFCVLLVISIIADFIFFIGFMTGFEFF